MQTERGLEGHHGLLPLVLSKGILVSVGSGGVGKTTLAAALGILAARAGRRTLVMTIDPARRLATSLGLDSLDSEAREVPSEKLIPFGIGPGRLHAMMLDPRRTFDDMVRRYAPDGDTAEHLMNSRLYRQISRRLAGAQEYAAMEKLHAVRMTGAFDLLVLDTPPTANALDFLEAPGKLVAAVESPAINLFVRTYRRAGKLSLNLLGFGAAYVIRRLARFTGGGFLDDIAAFLNDLSSLLGGMHDRAAQVTELLTRREVGFVIVTGPDPRSTDEAIGFHDRLLTTEMSPAAFVVNRVHPLGPPASGEDQLVETLEAVGAGAHAEPLAEVMRRSFEQMQMLAGVDAKQVERLRIHCGEGYPYVEVPLFGEDIHDIAGLVKLSEHLQ